MQSKEEIESKCNDDFKMIPKQIQLTNILIKERVSKEQMETVSAKLKKMKPGPLVHKQIFYIFVFKRRTSIGYLTANDLYCYK